MVKGKKNKTEFGRALIKDRFSNTRGKKLTNNNSMLHTTELQDGYNWGRLNMQSLTEQSSMQEFLSTAELAGTEFQAEKLNIKFVNPSLSRGLPTIAEKAKALSDFEQNKDVVKIPRRPAWTTTMPPDELHQKEREHFMEWRRSLALLQQETDIMLTPYEKNLEFWRQLWRVVERSDVVVQIVDARNPLLFRCEDLEKFVKEVSPDKMNMILLNKADFLTDEQRAEWARYFDSLDIKYAFFSALKVDEVLEVIEENSDREDDESDDECIGVDEIREEIAQLESAVGETEETLDNVLQIIAQELAQVYAQELALNTAQNSVQAIPEALQVLLGETPGENDDIKTEIEDSTQVLSRSELIELFRKIHKNPKVKPGTTTIGLVGYPNVGKSSTINALVQEKKVSVSATPGKTKHFQTLHLDQDIMLCDCPGLVMPSFVFSKADMVINGILPVDQMRDHVPPINLISSLIPRHVIEDMYSLMLPLPMEGEDQERGPTSEEFCNAYGFSRGFMTANGQPDNPRSARYVIKDFINGKLLYVNAPPGVSQKEFNKWPPKKESSSHRELPPREKRALKGSRITDEDVSKEFFSTGQQVHTKGIRVENPSLQAAAAASSKPWKILNKHGNKKKKEKLRRVYAHLDQH